MSSAKKKVIISACMLGEYCRYDGKTKEIGAVKEAFKGYEIIPFCPEAPLFGTPRERINVVAVNGEQRIITDETNVDVTQMLGEEIEQFCKEHPHTDAIVLKSKSPSCGYHTTPVLNEKKERVAICSGIAATIIEQKYPAVKIESELDFC
ncbi:COG1683: Uncharacterized conserved protein / FIG143828: Hypothetical protein YbgA [hydrothermal vent metagenome]|uniref:Uncharacterized protein n=1 Tax=hydrothermal vent metagenome TaxID=652676 RepID=A0A1W1C4X6_9ZZZZ